MVAASRNIYDDEEVKKKESKKTSRASQSSNLATVFTGGLRFERFYGYCILGHAVDSALIQQAFVHLAKLTGRGGRGRGTTKRKKEE